MQSKITNIVILTINNQDNRNQITKDRIYTQVTTRTQRNVDYSRATYLSARRKFTIKQYSTLQPNRDSMLPHYNRLIPHS